jgi:MFS family permease
MPMNYRRGWICVFLFTLTMINYTDRMALSVSAKPIAAEFGLSSVEMGYLLSSFLWTYVLCLIPGGLLVDRLGSKTVDAADIARADPYGHGWSSASSAPRTPRPPRRCR